MSRIMSRISLLFLALLPIVTAGSIADASPLSPSARSSRAAAPVYAAPPYAHAAQAPAQPAARHGFGGFLEMLFRGPPSFASRYDYGAGRGYRDPDLGPGMVAMPGDPSRAVMDPRYLRQQVFYSGSEAPGTVVVNTGERMLYLVQGGGRAIRYGIGVGRPGFTWSGVHHVSQKREWPDWTPPEEMLRRRPDLPRHMVGGPDNPLGARALYLGSTLYRIHGSNEPWTIGTQVSSGCIRMRNEDVIDLYSRVKVGTRVVVI
jgi:lipoprotein-anchoring transpeptidase ErfK/SrfK